MKERYTHRKNNVMIRIINYKLLSKNNLTLTTYM